MALQKSHELVKSPAFCIRKCGGKGWRCQNSAIITPKGPNIIFLELVTIRYDAGNMPGSTDCGVYHNSTITWYFGTFYEYKTNFKHNINIVYHGDGQFAY